MLKNCDSTVPLISTLNKTTHTFKDFFHHMKKILHLIGTFNVNKTIPLLQDFKFIKHVETFNQAVRRKIENYNRLWFHQCAISSCKYAFLSNPNIEQMINCPRCNKHQIVVGKNKAIFNSDEMKEIEIILANNSNLRSCPKCNKIMERSYGCNVMKCYFCSSSFHWDVTK